MKPQAVQMEEKRKQNLTDEREAMIAEMARLARIGDQQSSVELMRLAKAMATLNRMINEETTNSNK